MGQYTFLMSNLKRDEWKPRFPPLPRDQESPSRVVQTPDSALTESEFHFVEVLNMNHHLINQVLVLLIPGQNLTLGGELVLNALNQLQCLVQNTMTWLREIP